jgi:uncharacterized protein YbgA (DUF1722 family)
MIEFKCKFGASMRAFIPPTRAIRDYEQHLFKALRKPPRCGLNINVLMNDMCYFSNNLSKEEKSFLIHSKNIGQASFHSA